MPLSAFPPPPLILKERNLKRERAYPWAAKNELFWHLQWLSEAFNSWIIQLQHSTPTHQQDGHPNSLCSLLYVSENGQSPGWVCSTKIIPFWNTRATLFGSFFYCIFNRRIQTTTTSRYCTNSSFFWDTMVCDVVFLLFYSLGVIKVLTSHVYDMYPAI